MRITEGSLRRIIREALRRSLSESDLDSPDVNYSDVLRNLRTARQHLPWSTKLDARDFAHIRVGRGVSDPEFTGTTRERSVIEKSLDQFKSAIFTVIDNWDKKEMRLSIPPQYVKYIMDLKKKVDNDPKVEKAETKKALNDAMWLDANKAGTNDVSEIYADFIAAQPKLADAIRKMSVMFALRPHKDALITSINYFKQLDPENKVKDWDRILKAFNEWYESTSDDKILRQEDAHSRLYFSPEKAHGVSWGWLDAMGVSAQDLFETMVDKIEDKDIARRFASGGAVGGVEQSELNRALTGLVYSKSLMKP